MRYFKKYLEQFLTEANVVPFEPNTAEPPLPQTEEEDEEVTG
jgi:hypothetical protein